MREVEERTNISVEKELYFEKEGEIFSVVIQLKNISPNIEEESIKLYLKTLFSKAIEDLKLNNAGLNKRCN